jgi:hypothetical protein
VTLYLVSYEAHVNSPPDYYHRLQASLQLAGAHPLLASQWVMHSNSSAKDLCAYLKTVVHRQDKLFVNELTANNACTMLPVPVDGK